MARFIPTRGGDLLLNVDRVDYFRIIEMPDGKWVTNAVFGASRHAAVASHDSLADAATALNEALCV